MKQVRYGTDIETLARAQAGNYSESDDPSQDALIALANAYRAVKRLEERGVDIEFGGRPLALPGIERSYREVLHIRKGLNVDWLVTEVISKFGRLRIDGKSKV